MKCELKYFKKELLTKFKINLQKTTEIFKIPFIVLIFFINCTTYSEQQKADEKEGIFRMLVFISVVRNLDAFAYGSCSKPNALIENNVPLNLELSQGSRFWIQLAEEKKLEANKQFKLNARIQKAETTTVNLFQKDCYDQYESRFPLDPDSDSTSTLLKYDSDQNSYFKYPSEYGRMYWLEWVSGAVNVQFTHIK